MPPQQRNKRNTNQKSGKQAREGAKEEESQTDDNGRTKDATVLPRPLQLDPLHATAVRFDSRGKSVPSFEFRF